MSTPQHQQLAQAILYQISRVNPYTSNDRKMAYIYASGFLAGFLASLAEEDPYIYKKYKQHVDKQAIPKSPTLRQPRS